MNLIACIGPNRELGKDNHLIYRFTEDIEFFKKMTFSKVVIMGRKTFESIGEPLINRFNIVISRNSDYKSFYKGRMKNNIKFVTDIESALKVANSITDSEDDIFIIGGSAIYNETINRCTKLYITHVNKACDDADTFFPMIDDSTFKKHNLIDCGISKLKNSEESVIFEIFCYMHK